MSNPATDAAMPYWRSVTMGVAASGLARLSRRGASLWRLSAILGPASAPLLLLILALPHILPVGIPGTGIAFAVPMLFVAIALSRQQPRLLLPRWVRRRRLESPQLVRLLTTLDRLLAALERFSRSRFPGMLGRGMRIGMVAAIVLMVVLIVLPLPTGNPPAAAAVVAFTIGLLRGDGLFVVAGHGIALIAVAWNTAIAAAIWLAGFELWSIL